MAITAYTSSCADKNRSGGTRKLWIADAADIAESDFTISGGNITAITGISGFKAIVSDDYTVQHTYSDEKQDSNNYLLTHTVTLYVPNATKEIRDLHDELRTTCNLRLMIKDYGDNSTASRKWVIGYEDDGLNMKLQTAEFDGGMQLEDAKGVTFTFTGKSKVPAYAYTGSDPS